MFDIVRRTIECGGRMFNMVRNKKRISRDTGTDEIAVITDWDIYVAHYI